MKTFAVILASLLMLAFDGEPGIAQEKPNVEKAGGGRTVTVFVDNDRVKVYEGRFSPGEKSPQMSKRPDRVEFAMTDGQMRHYYQDGKVEDIMWKAGEVKWSERATYQQENIGTSEFRIRVVQLK
jgi:hypothetical protein